MRALVIFLLISAAACSEAGDASFVHLSGIRPAFVALNQTMKEACDQAQIECEMVNVGKVESDGTGDLIPVAIAKINSNLLSLKPKVPPTNQTDNIVGVYTNGVEVARITANGRVYLHGKQVHTDREYRAAMMALMKGMAPGCKH